MNQWTIAYQYWQVVFCKQGHAPLDDSRGYVEMTDNDLPLAISTLVEQQRNVWVWVEGDMRAIVDYFKKHYIYIKAAGGLVRNDDSLLLIHRNAHWDMAKGKVEPGETLAQAAVREVEEETGLQGIERGDLAVKTYHIYNLYGGWHLKQTSWFHMRCQSSHFTPQQEEGITEVCWCTLPAAKERLSQSYAMMALLASKI